MPVETLVERGVTEVPETSMIPTGILGLPLKSDLKLPSFNGDTKPRLRKNLLAHSTVPRTGEFDVHWPSLLESEKRFAMKRAPEPEQRPRIYSEKSSS